jgi:hypothetical protein
MFPLFKSQTPTLPVEALIGTLTPEAAAVIGYVLATKGEDWARMILHAIDCEVERAVGDALAAEDEMDEQDEIDELALPIDGDPIKALGSHPE